MTPDMKRIQLLGGVDSLRRAWWKLIFGVCAGLIGAVAILHVSPKQYEARANLLATTLERGGESSLDDLQGRLAMVAQTALTRPRSQSAVAEALGIDPEEVSLSAALASVRSRLRVSVTTHADNPEASEVLVRYRDGDAETAMRLTNTIAHLFITESARDDTTTESAAAVALQLEMMTEAVRPVRPVSPSAVLIYGVGLLAGPALLLGSVCGRRLLSPVLDTLASVQEASDVRVLVGLPEIAMAADGRTERSQRSTNVLYSAISLAVLAVVLLVWA